MRMSFKFKITGQVSALFAQYTAEFHWHSNLQAVIEMMQYAEKKYLKVSLGWIAFCTGSLLAGCEPQPMPAESENSTAAQPVSAASANAHIAAAKQAEEQGKKLTEVAGQATMRNDPSPQSSALPKNAQEFIGRFHAIIPCDDGFIPCQQGTAEFILNLLPDGSAHRSIIHYGKVFADKPMSKEGNTTYRKDRWTLDEEDMEIIVHRQEGVNFYYRIQDRDHLIMDVDRIRSDTEGRNQELFDEGYPQPAKAYVLTRDQKGQ